jgi:small-conductance mechanosensitive channel
MRIRSWLPALILALLAGAVATGLFLTRERPTPEQQTDRPQDAAAPRRPGERLVDMQPLLTARRVSALARTPEEQELARQARRLADHAVDLAFAESIRRIAEEKPEPTPELRTLAAERDRAQAVVAAAARQVEDISRHAAAAAAGEQQRLAEQLELARAEQELAQDELDDVAERLGRAGGDPQARIQRLRTAYDAGQKDPQLPAVPAAGPSAGPSPAGEDPSLLGRLRAWNALRGKRAQLAAARGEALDRAQRLTARRERITRRIQAADAAAEAAIEAEAALAPGQEPDPKAREARLASVKGAAEDRRRLTAIGRRLQDQQELAEVYGDWIALVEVQLRAALHQVLRVAAWLLLAAVGVLVAGRLVEQLFRGDGEEGARQAGRLRTVARLAVQVAGLVAVVLIALGMPGEATTIVGLAGAGLTVAMKDFIVAFFGWFVLMGRNGIRVGDWVEIEGVGGEVAEVGVLHTVLLETGSWTAAGHPTGRRVSFVNSFAIEGHFFNFSTSGQWMWDELRVVVPAGKDPYQVVDSVQQLVERETEANAKEAELEWRKTTSRYRVRTFSAVPGVSIVPTSGGLELDVRFITRAYDRHSTRRRINQAVVELIHGKRDERAAGPAGS